MAYVTTTQHGAVALITIARTAALNALNSAVLAELSAAFDAVDLTITRCVVLTGAGDKSFVAGADIAELQGMSQVQAAQFSAQGNALFLKIEQFALPVIAAINGFALGGGNELALCCDIRLCAEHARFAQPEVTIGITPGFGGTQRLARVVGLGMAKQMLYTGSMISAGEAHRIGLVNAVYPAAQLLPQALQLATHIAGNAPMAVQRCKQAINDGVTLPIAQACAVETKQFATCFETADQQQRMAAFLAKTQK